MERKTAAITMVCIALLTVAVSAAPSLSGSAMQNETEFKESVDTSGAGLVEYNEPVTSTECSFIPHYKTVEVCTMVEDEYGNPDSETCIKEIRLDYETIECSDTVIGSTDMKLGLDPETVPVQCIVDGSIDEYCLISVLYSRVNELQAEIDRLTERVSL